MAEKKSEFVTKLDFIQNNIHKNLLKKPGFKKRGRTWNRSTSDGLVQVINFQAGQYPVGDKDSYVIPGLRENLYGFFTVNLGIFIPEISELQHNEKPREFVQEYLCQIRSRFRELINSKKDIWWDLSKNENVISRDIQNLIENHALPFFEKLENRDLIIKNLVKISKNFKLLNSGTCDLQLALIFYKKRDLEKAKKYLKAQFNSSKHKGHKEYLVELAEKLNIADFLK